MLVLYARHRCTCCALLCARPCPHRPAAASPVILILGDSISAGYGLPDRRRLGHAVAAAARRAALSATASSMPASAATPPRAAARGSTRCWRSTARRSPSSSSAATTACAEAASTRCATNLDAMAPAAQKAGSRVLLVGMRMPPNYGAAYVRALRRELCGRCQRAQDRAGPVSVRRLRRQRSDVPARSHPSGAGGAAEAARQRVAVAEAAARRARQGRMSERRDRAAARRRRRAAPASRPHRRAQPGRVRARPRARRDATIRCSTTSSAPRSARCTRPRPSRRAGWARRWSRATSRACSRPTSPSKPRDWRPLVYCWRGGQRSRALAHVLNEIGWRAMQLDGGYRAYRRHVVARLEVLPARFAFVVVCGLTGSGKSRLLGALADAGAQTLDLEALARHRGSLLGGIPGHAAALAEKLRKRDLHDRLEHPRPRASGVRRIRKPARRRVQLPDALLAAHARRPRRHAAHAARATHRAAQVRTTRTSSPIRRCSSSSACARWSPLHGKATLARWDALAASGDWDALIGELLEPHYDPLYGRSMARHFPAAEPERRVDVRDPIAGGLCRAGCRCACRKRRLQDRR